jgi:hypothetical protein
MSLRIDRLAITGLLLASLLGCDGAPHRPLMSARTSEQSFGYVEQRLGPNTFTVEYQTPFTRTSLDENRRRDSAERLRVVATDLAQLRAAHLAKAEGYRAFRITDQGFDTNVEIYDNLALPPRFILASPVGGARIEQTPPLDVRSAWMQGNARLAIQLETQASAGSLDADEVIERLGPTYAGVVSGGG